MNNQLVETLKKDDKEQLSEAIRDMIRQNIKHQAEFAIQVDESLDFDTLARYIGSFARNVGIAAAGILFTVSLVFSGGIPAGMIIGGSVAASVASTFYAYHRALNVDKVRLALMNTQAGRKFDKLVDIIEQRDSLLKEIGQYKKFKDREKASKRIKKPMQQLTERMKDLSSQIRADLAEIGDAWSMNEYDKENLMAMLDHGERGVVSEVLSDRRELEKLKFDEQQAA